MPVPRTPEILQSDLMSRRRLLYALALRTLRSVIVLFLALLLTALLLRFAPGSEVDERELSGRMSNKSVEQIRAERARGHDLFAFFPRYVGGIVAGRTLNSELYGEELGPVLRERFEMTAATVSKGLMIGWCAAITLSILVSVNTAAGEVAGAGVLTAMFLSIPSALLAVICLLARLPAHFAIAAAVFPRVFPVAEEQFRSAMIAPHVIFARAKGLPHSRLFFSHVVPGTIPPLLALAGVSAVLAIGVSIPVEALLDSPGIGQLAWKAALGRDLPVLVTVTLFITAVTVVVNWCVDLALLSMRLKSV